MNKFKIFPVNRTSAFRQSDSVSMHIYNGLTKKTLSVSKIRKR